MLTFSPVIHQLCVNVITFQKKSPKCFAGHIKCSFDTAAQSFLVHYPKFFVKLRKKFNQLSIFSQNVPPETLNIVLTTLPKRIRTKSKKRYILILFIKIFFTKKFLMLRRMQLRQPVKENFAPSPKKKIFGSFQKMFSGLKSPSGLL